MGSLFYNNNGTIDRCVLYMNENGTIYNEDDMDIYFNNGREIISMPQKQNLLVNMTPNFTFAYHTVVGSNYMLANDFVLKANNDVYDFCSFNNSNKTYKRPNGNNDLSMNRTTGIWMLGKSWNQMNINLPEPIFDGTNQATISMTFGSTSHNNDGFFWFLDNNTKWGVQGHWSPFIFRFRNNVNSGYFELPSSYGEGGVHNMTVTFNGRTVKIYWNGVKVAENNSINTDQGICSRIWLNGYYNHTSTFANVSYYSFRVWKTCLTDDEVLTAYKFDEGYIS